MNAFVRLHFRGFEMKDCEEGFSQKSSIAGYSYFLHLDKNYSN